MIEPRHLYLTALLIVVGNAATLVAIDQWQQAYPEIYSNKRLAYDACADGSAGLPAKFNRWSPNDRAYCIAWTNVRRR